MKLDTGEIRQYFCSSKIRFLHIRHFLHHQTTTNNFAHAQTLSRMSSVRSYFLRSCLFTYDIMKKRDDFNFKIINFPNMCSNIPASPAYGVYISQFIRYARASSNFSDILKRHLDLRNRLLDHGYEKIRLIRSFKKFIFRCQDLLEIYSVSAERIINDGFSYSENV